MDNSKKNKYLFLPKFITSSAEIEKIRKSGNIARESVKYEYLCPCCGSITFSVSSVDAVAYICPVCYWENDVFTELDDEPSDENEGMTLNEARENFKKFGVCAERFLGKNKKL